MHSRTTIDCDFAPRFTCAYLRVANDECAFIEAHTSHAVLKLLAALEAAGKRVEDVKYVVVTHAHLDHAGGAGALLTHLPNATLLAHPRAARHLIDPSKLVASATSVYGAERFAKLYGTIAPIPAERVNALDDGATFDVGGATFTVHHTAGHAKHHFIVDDPTIQTVYTGDTFGLVYPDLQRGKRFALASTSPTDFDAADARKSIDKVLSLGRTAACLTHFDEVHDLEEVASQLRGWIERSEAWVEAAVASDATLSAIHARIAADLRAAIESESIRLGLSFGPSDWELLATDIDLNAQGLAFVADKRRAAQ